MEEMTVKIDSVSYNDGVLVFIYAGLNTKGNTVNGSIIWDLRTPLDKVSLSENISKDIKRMFNSEITLK